MDEVRRLINGDAFDLGERDAKSALFHSAKNNLPLIVKGLSDAGLDLNTTDDEGKTAVFYANRNNSMDALCRLIEHDAEFNLDEIDAKSVLFHAAEYNYSGTVDKLNDKNFNLNITDDEGKTAVFYANRNNNMDALCRLIECYAKFELDEIDAKSVLFHAAECNYSETVDKLYYWKSFNLNITDDEGKTAVFYANRNNSMDALCKLIECYAKFELDEIDAKSVLFHAAECNYSETVDKLYYWKSFNLNITDDEGKTAVFYANRNNSMDALCKLIGCYAKFELDEIDAKSVLFHAAEYDYFETVDKLNDKNFDLNITDDEGKTAVFYANRNNSIFALCALIECGAKFKLDEIDAKSVLFHAAEYDYFETVGQLYWEGFNLHITDDEGKTAVFYANRNNSIYALCALIECGAKFKLDEIDAKSVLFHAAEYDYFETVDQLYWKGFNLHITDDEGKTAVFYANRNNSIYALCALIECGAKFKLDEIDAKSVLFHAAEYDYFETVDKLNDKNFDLNITDDEGKTAVFYANRYRNTATLCKLIECYAKFELDEIDAKSVLFHAAKEDRKDLVKPLHYAGLDLNITDDYGKTVAFYGSVAFLDTLMELVEVVIDARDNYGRTPLFYALGNGNTRKAGYLVEKGGNLQVKDYCNTSIFTFVVEKFISRHVAEKELFTSHVQNEQAVFNILYCQAPLLSIKRFPHLIKPYAILNKTNVLEALAFARERYVIQNSHKVGDIDEVVLMIRRGNVMDVPRILSLLINLGGDPQTTDTAGNAAFHYATLLPLYGVTQEVVMDICKKLKKFGTIFHARNHQGQSPLLFCLSANTWKVATENNTWQSSIKGLVEVFRCLLSSRNVILNSEFLFHRIISLIQQGLELNAEVKRKAAVQTLVDVLELLQAGEEAVLKTVNYTDNFLNSPLHLWASIALKTSQDYTICGTEDFTFESIMKRILDHLLKCGVHINARNVDDETPLHKCRTWAAVKLLLGAGANPNVQNSSGHSPLLAAAKKKYALKKTGHLYPDVTEEPESFWKCVIQKKLDPWVADKQEEAILSVLIESGDFSLSRALVEVACKEGSVRDDVKLSILRVICKDKSNHTHWKTILVDIILNSAGTRHLALESPLRLCCQNIVKFGMFDHQQPGPFQATNDKPGEDDGQPPTKKTRKDESIKEQKSNETQVTYDSVYCKIAEQLLSHGVDIYSPDQSGICCLDVANECPSLRDLLTKPTEINTIPVRIPWASNSERYRCLLAKVARRQECKIVNQIWYHREHLGSGSFGHIFAGINKEDGREVAVKRVEKLRLIRRQEDRREIENLVALVDCEHAVRYISFFEDEDFSYIVLELMEGNLEEFFDENTVDTAEITHLCKDVVMGLQFLHERKIVHRDLKPQNILYKIHPKLCLKIADFGLSRAIDNTVFSTISGTRCWMAPEVFKPKPDSVGKNHYVTESDVFSCGLLVHYILSGKKHPFSPTLQLSQETVEDNVKNGKMEGWDESLCSEATDLIKRMLESNENDRPSAAEALEHPLFWSNKRKVNFLKAASDHKKFRKAYDPNIEAALSKSMERGRWNNKQYRHMRELHTEMSAFKNYRVRSVVDLIRLIRNVYAHSNEISLGECVEVDKLLFKDYVFFENFPDLVMEVYKYVIKHKLDEAEEVKSAMDKEY